jgi:hypothetical protein
LYGKSLKTVVWPRFVVAGGMACGIDNISLGAHLKNFVMFEGHVCQPLDD